MPSKWTWIALVASVLWYRNGSILKNCILNRSPLPIGYVAGGIDYSTQCHPLRDSSSSQPLSESVNSCEDLTFWELYDAEGREVVQRPVILSCDPNRRNWNTVMGPLRDPNPHGALWLYLPPPSSQYSSILPSSLHHSKTHRIQLVGYPAGHDFHPLGVEVWPSYGGNKSTLYAVNHARARTVIEQFTLDPSTSPIQARHVRTISSPWFVSPNALALTSEHSFYVSNDHLITRRWPSVIGKILPVVESVLALPLGFVAHVELNPPTPEGEGQGGDAIAKHEIVKAFIPFPNGVALSPGKEHGQGGDRLAIVSTSFSKIYVYERNKTTNALGSSAKYAIPVPFSPDNVFYTERIVEGRAVEEVIVGGHPNFPDLTAVAAGKQGAKAGSWVASILLQPPQSQQGESTSDSESLPSTPSYDTQAPVSLGTKLPLTRREEWTLETFFQSNGDEEAGGFGGSTRGLRDPKTGDVFVSGLYARDGAFACDAVRKPY